MNYLIPLKYLPPAAMVLTLAACSSSSDPVATPLSSQAIDGYIVQADVLCDGMESGTTKAAGRFTCPAGTILSKVTGGYDVGTDSVVSEGTVPFTGVLTAPATEPYVTPMTTLSVALAQDNASEDGTIDLSKYNAAKSDLAVALGVPLDDLFSNPAVNNVAAQSNAKVHQVLVAFAPNSGNYEEATAAFAMVIAERSTAGLTVDLSSNVSETMALINTELQDIDPTLVLATVDLDQASANVAAANIAIDAAVSPDRVATVSQKALIDQAPVTIDRANAMVMLSNGMQAVEQLSINEFENPAQTDGLYNARLFSGMTRVSYDNAVFKFNQNINNTRVTVGFEVKSVNPGDLRSLTFFSDDIVVAATKGNSSSLTVSMMSEDSTFDLIGTDATGKPITKATVETDGETFSSNGDTLTVDLERINSQLSDLGFEEILATTGDYRVTLVIKGLRINELDGSDISEAEEFTVNADETTIVGNGFRGYVSVIR